MDIGGKSTIKSRTRPGEYAEIEFYRRGWTSANSFRLEGDIFNSQGEVIYRIEGRWNDSIYIIDNRSGHREKVWTKEPYPENWQFMYGMTRFSVQLNYFPRQLHDKVAPTDSRRRPDQRALENGDMKLANREKIRLEEKQRAVRRHNEKHNIEPKPYYFDLKYLPEEGKMYYMYNGTYFEHDRPNQDWSKLPDIFSEKLPFENE